ncbi:hypothetical protein ACLBKU_02935 [Erythrobacter sp. NE805]|uniref:hypothetical protein n=1 Tax=Erythrobacter sp. NE805 TaxID=3389875 RepID=UPI00396B35EE
MRRAALALVLMLAACGGEPQDKAETAPAASATPAGPAARPAPPAADGLSAEDAAAIAKGEIPARYHGVWDAVTGSCSPNSDLRIAVSARRVQFYESVGNVSAMGHTGPDAIADLVMTGEGEEWFQSTRFSLVETPEGERLTLTDAIEPGPQAPIPLRRCPA